MTGFYPNFSGLARNYFKKGTLTMTGFYPDSSGLARKPALSEVEGDYHRPERA